MTSRSPAAPVLLLGGGGMAHEVLDLAAAAGAVVVGVVDRDPESARTRMAGRDVAVVGADEDLAAVAARLGAGGAVACVLDPEVRARLMASAAAAGLDLPVLCHPAATVPASVRLGPASIVNAGARFSGPTETGRGAYIHHNATVGHDVRLGEVVSVLPGAGVSGGVVLGDGVTVGAGAVVLPGIEVGAGATIGAGAVVTRNVPAGVTVTGIPAR